MLVGMGFECEMFLVAMNSPERRGEFTGLLEGPRLHMLIGEGRCCESIWYPHLIRCAFTTSPSITPVDESQQLCFIQVRTARVVHGSCKRHHRSKPQHPMSCFVVKKLQPLHATCHNAIKNATKALKLRQLGTSSRLKGECLFAQIQRPRMNILDHLAIQSACMCGHGGQPACCRTMHESQEREDQGGSENVKDTLEVTVRRSLIDNTEKVASPESMQQGFDSSSYGAQLDHSAIIGREILSPSSHASPAKKKTLSCSSRSKKVRPVSRVFRIPSRPALFLRNDDLNFEVIGALETKSRSSSALRPTVSI
ncbi:uncharacterized protein MYCFIDRAFT_176056 [Pseudocercospora fijiensis CIRAD86]|uniref:Uncharacterized protein n=1 Tax=Pseudocercospora fijiensis (strain CIRAD86) TaxID=383855 RepID=M3AZA0_PSEFD|nr:uncharacterized protein MYCFIDRAFT_176056 [Pseudocercospora fijiensis CIRAD86]EME82508.1 hypothetical protein MYCFIDRAFT_176056 [Pseudocercospora fijiensis CIRAD86]